ncbi:MAG: hypothetical protein [Microviridae sp.]|nr:MAG: hypothetical protein [Microviridae sp.]
MKISLIRKLMPVASISLHPQPRTSLPSSSIIRGAVPLRDVLSGVFNGSPIPPDYLGEPHEDTKDTSIHEIDPMSNFGFDKLDREAAIMAHAETEGNRARSARARTSNPTGDMSNPNPPVDPTATPASPE